MGVVRCKDGVKFLEIAPGGFRILSAIDQIAASMSCDVTITSACDGVHSGTGDPHYSGNAYDIRTRDLPDAQVFLKKLQELLGSAFFAFIEDPGTDNEHIHVQVRRGTVFPATG